jgi:hypothetical protein
MEKAGIPKPYTVPTKPDMAVCLCYFNPAGHVRLFQNLCTVLQMLTNAKIPWFLGELATKDTPWAFHASETIFQYRVNSYMWYKEQILNCVMARVPSHFTKLCILDGDILFEDPDWYVKTSACLETVPVCQPFSKLWLTDTQFKKTISHRAATAVPNLIGHPGTAWAFDRAWLTGHPLPEFAILGSGDNVFAQSIGSKFKIPECMFGCLLPPTNDYAAQFQTPTPTSFVEGVAIHLYHGQRANRKYQSRYITLGKALESVGISKLEDALVRNSDGFYEWAPAIADQMNAAALQYFVERDEDD